MENTTDSTDVLGAERARIRLLTVDDLEQAGRLLADAFADEPLSAALHPDPRERRALSLITARREVRAHLGFATAFGAELDGRLAGVALWHPPSVHPSPFVGRLRWTLEMIQARATVRPALASAASMLWRERRSMLRTLWVRQRRVRSVGAQPCWYLAVLGTAAEFRGRGVARVLLEHILERCDVDGLPAWLETTEGVNARIYERFGFRTEVRIPSGGALPDFWLMRREPPGTALPPDAWKR